MSKKDKSADDKPKGKGGLIKIVLGAVLLLGLGAGGAVGAVQMGYIGSSGETEPDLPKLVKKGDDDPYAPASDSKDKNATPVTHGEGGSEYRVAYYTFEEPFTSNLRGSTGLIQLSIAASTKHDGRVVQWMKLHELAIRSEVLVELAATPEQGLSTVKGKAKLQKRLTDAVNRVLEEKEGFGGVDKVHFRSLLVQ